MYTYYYYICTIEDWILYVFELTFCHFTAIEVNHNSKVHFCILLCDIMMKMGYMALIIPILLIIYKDTNYVQKSYISFIFGLRIIFIKRSMVYLEKWIYICIIESIQKLENCSFRYQWFFVICCINFIRRRYRLNWNIQWWTFRPECSMSLM